MRDPELEQRIVDILERALGDDRDYLKEVQQLLVLIDRQNRSDEIFRRNKGVKPCFVQSVKATTADGCCNALDTEPSRCSNLGSMIRWTGRPSGAERLLEECLPREGTSPKTDPLLG